VKPEEIREDATYIGTGACWARTVDFIFEVAGILKVHWYTPSTLPVRLKDGRTFHTPNRSCSLRHFARWALREDGDTENGKD